MLPITRQARRRRAFTMYELVLCSAMFTFLITAILTLTSQVNFWTMDAENAMADARDIDFLTRSFLEDVKSCAAVEPIDGGMLIVKSDGVAVTYHLGDATLYRNDERVIDNVMTAAFDTNALAGIDLLLRSGQRILVQARA